jgi:hypothetical protein
MEDSRIPKRVMTERVYTKKKRVDQSLDGEMTFKRTYERWGLKAGEEKLRTETSGCEEHRRPRIT